MPDFRQTYSFEKPGLPTTYQKRKQIIRVDVRFNTDRSDYPQVSAELSSSNREAYALERHSPLPITGEGEQITK